MTLGEKIRARRLELRITLREFARRVGVSAPYVTDLEAGRRHPSPEILARIAEELTLPQAELEALDTRSEEHTSELQSRPHLVCRLLLEKNKNKHKDLDPTQKKRTPPQ